MNFSFKRNEPAKISPVGFPLWSPPEAIVEALGDDNEMVVELIDAFQTDTRARLERVRAALSAGDATQLRREAHTVKGSSRQIGADALGEVCEQIEHADQSTSLAQFAELVQRMQELFAQIDGSMSAYRARRGPASTPVFRNA